MKPQGYVDFDNPTHLNKLVDELREEIEELIDQLATAHRDATEEVAKAHKRGWEQAKSEAKDAVECADYDADDWSRRNPEHVAVAAIAAMEYSHKEG